MATPVFIAFLIGVLCFYPTSLWAKVMYITDRIEIGVRSGTGIEQRIVTMVKTGDKVQVLEGDKTWSKVQLPDGKVGWISTRFLVEQVKTISSADPKMQEELRGFKENSQTLVQEKEALIQEKRKLIQDLAEAKQSIQTLRQEKTIEHRPEMTELTAKNQKLEKEISQYKKQIVDLNQKEQTDTSGDHIKWFLSGAAVLILGLILGWITNRGRRKPNRYY